MKLQHSPRSQNLQVDKFRKLCGVRKDSRWPLLSDPIRIDKASGEPFWTPDFEKDVRDSVNMDLFEKIGRAVMEDLKVSTSLDVIKSVSDSSNQDKKDRPAALLADGVWFNKDTIIEFAKTSFRGFKTIAIAQRDEEKLKRLKMNQQSTKLRDRRKLVPTGKDLSSVCLLIYSPIRPMGTISKQCPNTLLFTM